MSLTLLTIAALLETAGCFFVAKALEGNPSWWIPATAALAAFAYLVAKAKPEDLTLSFATYGAVYLATAGTIHLLSTQQVQPQTVVGIILAIAAAIIMGA